MKFESKNLIIIFVLLACLSGLMMYAFFDTKEEQENYKTQMNEQKKEKKKEKRVFDLPEKIDQYLVDHQVDTSLIGISVRSLDGENEYLLNGDQEFIAASTYKLPLSLLWYEKINAGEYKLSDGLTYLDNCYEPGGPVGDNYWPGAVISLEELLTSVIMNSDNTAAHILFEHLGGWASFKEQAAKYASQPMDDLFYSMDNYLTPRYSSDVVQYLYDNKASFETLISHMKQAMPGQYLDTTIQVGMAQKYGSFDYAENAVGFVEAKIPYSISVYTSLGAPGIQVMADINQLCYEYFNQ